MNYTHRCQRCHWQTFDFEALCRVCGWNQWDGGHVHSWWGSWVDLSEWAERHGFADGDGE